MGLSCCHRRKMCRKQFLETRGIRQVWYVWLRCELRLLTLEDVCCSPECLLHKPRSVFNCLSNVTTMNVIEVVFWIQPVVLNIIYHEFYIWWNKWWLDRAEIHALYRCTGVFVAHWFQVSSEEVKDIECLLSIAQIPLPVPAYRQPNSCILTKSHYLSQE